MSRGIRALPSGGGLTTAKGTVRIYRAQPSRRPTSVVDELGSCQVPMPFSYGTPLTFGPVDGLLELPSPIWLGLWFGEVLLYEHRLTMDGDIISVMNGTLTIERGWS